MWRRIDYNGRCTCIWDCLNGVIHDDIIRIIDGYTHRGDNIRSAIIKELEDTSEGKVAVLGRWNRRKEWIFDGNLAGESFVNMNYRDHTTWIKDPSARIVMRAENDIEVMINGTHVPISDGTIISDDRIDVSWGYRWITPFSRKRRHYLRSSVDQYLLQDATSGCMNTFDSACDVAHDAISRWYHCDPEFETAVNGNTNTDANADADADADANVDIDGDGDMISQWFHGDPEFDFETAVNGNIDA